MKSRSNPALLYLSDQAILVDQVIQVLLVLLVFQLLPSHLLDLENRVAQGIRDNLIETHNKNMHNEKLDVQQQKCTAHNTAMTH